MDGGRGECGDAEAASDTHVGATGPAASDDDGVERLQVTHVGAAATRGDDDDVERTAPTHGGAHPTADDDGYDGRERVTHVGAHTERRAERPSAAARRRASQSIPPAVRREALRRFGGQCAAPGCVHSDWLDMHHLRYREGGKTRVDQILPLCGCHHGAAHAGRLIIDGDTTDRPLRFLHADGCEYGSATLAPIGEGPQRGRELGGAMETACDALCRLGFRKAEVRRVLRELESSSADTHVGRGAGADLQGIVRQALAVLTGQTGLLNPTDC